MTGLTPDQQANLFKGLLVVILLSTSYVLRWSPISSRLACIALSIHL
jgi:hypothetical protein